MTVKDPQKCPECGGTLEPVESTRFRDWDCGNRSVPTRLMASLIIITGVLMAMTRLALLGLVIAFAGGYFLLAHTEKCIRYECPDCGHKQDALPCDEQEPTGKDRRE